MRMHRASSILDSISNMMLVFSLAGGAADNKEGNKRWADAKGNAQILSSKLIIVSTIFGDSRQNSFLTTVHGRVEQTVVRSLVTIYSAVIATASNSLAFPNDLIRSTRSVSRSLRALLMRPLQMAQPWLLPRPSQPSTVLVGHGAAK